MKGVPALVLLAALGFAVAGCGMGHPAGSITVTGTTTLSNVQTGTPVTCKGGSPRVEVPPGQASDNTSEVLGGETTRLRLTRHLDGSVTVSCTRK
jgi:hypothetical protein